MEEPSGTGNIYFRVANIFGFLSNCGMICCYCYNSIESERLELIPHTHVCGGCARLFNVGKKKKGHMIFGHKTGAEIQVLSAETFESQKKYWTPNGARSAVKNFSKHICS
jgi:hypothetical protein